MGRIPGEVSRTGAVPIQAGTSRSAPAPTGVREREHTPPVGAARRSNVDSAMTNSWKPSIAVIGFLLLVALIVGGLLWSNLRFAGGDVVSTTTVLPGAESATQPVPSIAADGSPAAPSGVGASITAVATFDPDGDNQENDGEVARAIDGDPSTSWATVCYESKFMGAKRGVGLVVSLDTLTQQSLAVDVTSAPYQLRFFGSADEFAPTDLDQWGPELGEKAFANEPGTVTSPQPPAPIRHVLVLLNEIGADDTCTTTNPYRGRLGEITLVD